MNILVTGGAGYIGSILVPALLSQGHAVTVLDNFRYGQTPLMDVCGDPNIRIIRGDAGDRAILKKYMEDAEILIPLACLTGAPLCEREPEEAKRVIKDAIDLMIRLRRKNQKIIYPNTNSGYGIGSKNSLCTEKTPLRPISLYGKLKVEAEQRIMRSGNSVCFRLATVFGASPRMRLDLLVNDFTYRAVADRFLVLFEADFKRNYIHVRDVARAFLHVIDHFHSMKEEVYNVGLSDTNISKRELCEAIKRHIPSFYFTEATIGKDVDKRNYIVSNEKIEKTGFRPHYSLDQGIRELITTYEIVRRNNFSNV